MTGSRVVLHRRWTAIGGWGQHPWLASPAPMVRRLRGDSEDERIGRDSRNCPARQRLIMDLMFGWLGRLCRFGGPEFDRLCLVAREPLWDLTACTENVC